VVRSLRRHANGLRVVSVRHSGRERDRLNWYVEPGWCVDALFDALPDLRALHDPCAGGGTIVDRALARGFRATGADIVDRADGRFPTLDFLTDTATYPNLVTNPPYLPKEQGPAFVKHALRRVVPGGHVALLVSLNFFASRGRHQIFADPQCELILFLSRRPSMPPGQVLRVFGEAIRKNGSTDYGWAVFQRDRHCGQTQARWAPP
jgi:hypothetical protein